jgi:hypothetical protein
MGHILVPSRGPKDWRRLLADPEKHWRRGFSARTLAAAWEDSNGWPSEVRRALARAESPSLRQADILFAVPEYRVDLPGGRRPSQSDIFVLAQVRTGLATIMIEGKVHEDFGPLFDDWYSRPSSGKETRWRFITTTLGLHGVSARGLRYQLFHRLASAALAAQRFGAADAVMLVHSFGHQPDHFADYQAFVELFGRQSRRGEIIQLASSSPTRLHAGWVVGNREYLRA